MKIDFPKDYQEFLKSIKRKVANAQLKAATKINQELIILYWEIGRAVLEKQEIEGWGAKTIEKLAKDLKALFTNMRGFSTRNLQFMVQFSRKYPTFEFVKQVVSQIPWGHNIVLLQKIDNQEERLWYVSKTIENGWSRSVLLL